MTAKRIEMHRLQELVRLHRMGQYLSSPSLALLVVPTEMFDQNEA